MVKVSWYFFCILKYLLYICRTKPNKMDTNKIFDFNYTKEQSEKFRKELRESSDRPMKNPYFYTTWNMATYGTKEYDERFKKIKK